MLDEKLEIKIVYGDGPEAMLNAIQHSLHHWYEMNIRKEDIRIYIPKLVQRLLTEYTAQYVTSPMKGNMCEIEMTELFGVRVLPGYEFHKVVIAWTEGELYGRKPVVLTWEPPVSVKHVKIED